MLKAVLIDDELSARLAIKKLLSPLLDSVNVVAECESVVQAVEAIKKEQPDLLFLDIDLTDGTGFDVLSEFTSPNFQVIFITGHNEYAIKAFRHSAIDYLLKPINKDDLHKAVEKALKKQSQQENQQKLELMLRSLQNKQFSKIAVPSSDGYEFINKDEILYSESDGSYTYLISTSDKKIISTMNLKKMEELLFEPNFFRIHKSFIVNINFVRKVVKADGGVAIMDNGTEIPIARRRKVEFLALLGM